MIYVLYQLFPICTPIWTEEQTQDILELFAGYKVLN